MGFVRLVALVAVLVLFAVNNGIDSDRAAAVIVVAAFRPSSRSFVARSRFTSRLFSSGGEDAKQQRQRPSTSAATTAKRVSLSSTSSSSSSSSAASVPSFLREAFQGGGGVSECDNVNVPPSLSIILRGIEQLAASGGTDIRGVVVDHPRFGNIAAVAKSIASDPQCAASSAPPLTPFAAHCFGHALAEMVLDRKQQQQQPANDDDDKDSSEVTIAIGIDPRLHSERLADALVRGAESAGGGAASATSSTVDPVEGGGGGVQQQPSRRVKAVYTGLATTPAMAFMAQRQFPSVDAAVMVTASHLPSDKNGVGKICYVQCRTCSAPFKLRSSHFFSFFLGCQFKLFMGGPDNDTLFTREMMKELGARARERAATLFRVSWDNLMSLFFDRLSRIITDLHSPLLFSIVSLESSLTPSHVNIISYFYLSVEWMRPPSHVW